MAVPQSRRTTNDDGQLMDYWNGQLKLLSPSSDDLQSLVPLTDGFMLVQIGREQAEPTGVVAALAQMLLRQLGREVRGLAAARSEITSRPGPVCCPCPRPHISRGAGVEGRRPQ